MSGSSSTPEDANGSKKCASTPICDHPANTREKSETSASHLLQEMKDGKIKNPGLSKSCISSYRRRHSTGSHASSTAISDPFADTSDSSSKPLGSMSRLIKERMMMSPGFSKSSISSYGRRDSTGSHSSSTAISDPFADTSDSSSKPQGSMSRLIKERIISSDYSKSSISSYGRRDSTGSHTSSTAITCPLAGTSDSSSKAEGSMSQLIKERIMMSPGFSKSSITSEGRRDSSDSNSSETVPMSCPPANVKPHGAMSRRIKEMKGRMTIKTPRSSVQMSSPGASTSKLSHSTSCGSESGHGSSKALNSYSSYGSSKLLDSATSSGYGSSKALNSSTSCGYGDSKTLASTTSSGHGSSKELHSSTSSRHGSKLLNSLTSIISADPTSSSSLDKVKTDFRPRMFRKLFQNSRDTPGETMALHPRHLAKSKIFALSHSTADMAARTLYDSELPQGGSHQVVRTDFYVNAKGQIVHINPNAEVGDNIFDISDERTQVYDRGLPRRGHKVPIPSRAKCPDQDQFYSRKGERDIYCPRKKEETLNET